MNGFSPVTACLAFGAPRVRGAVLSPPRVESCFLAAVTLALLRDKLFFAVVVACPALLRAEILCALLVAPLLPLLRFGPDAAVPPPSCLAPASGSPRSLRLPRCPRRLGSLRHARTLRGRKIRARAARVTGAALSNGALNLRRSSKLSRNCHARQNGSEGVPSSLCVRPRKRARGSTTARTHDMWPE